VTKPLPKQVAPEPIAEPSRLGGLSIPLSTSVSSHVCDDGTQTRPIGHGFIASHG